MHKGKIFEISEETVPAQKKVINYVRVIQEHYKLLNEPNLYCYCLAMIMRLVIILKQDGSVSKKTFLDQCEHFWDKVEVVDKRKAKKRSVH